MAIREVARMSSAPPPSPLPPDGFLSDEQLRAMLADGAGHRLGARLCLADGSEHVLQDAVRVLSCSRAVDPYGLTGRVVTLGALLRQGFVLTASRIGLGPCIYDVEGGVLAQPLSNADASGVQRALELDARTG